MDDPKLVDLPPHQWKSERDKPREPIFGDGWPILLGLVLTIALATWFVESGWVERWLAIPLGGVLGTVIATSVASLTGDRKSR
jgi:hypothetical protein